MDGPDTFLWSIIFGAIGMGYLVYGKKQARFVPLICGIVLCSFTYFISDLLSILLVGGALIVIPFWLKS
jgi:hypothetical protein